MANRYTRIFDGGGKAHSASCSPPPYKTKVWHFWRCWRWECSASLLCHPIRLSSYTAELNYTKSFKNDLIGGWSWFETVSFTSPLRKAWLQSVAGWMHFLLQILWEKLDYRLEPVWSIFLYKSFKRSLITGWGWCKAFSITNQSQVLVRTAWLQDGAVLRPMHHDLSSSMQPFADSLS